MPSKIVRSIVNNIYCIYSHVVPLEECFSCKLQSTYLLEYASGSFFGITYLANLLIKHYLVWYFSVIILLYWFWKSLISEYCLAYICKLPAINFKLSQFLETYSALTTKHQNKSASIVFEKFTQTLRFPVKACLAPSRNWRLKVHIE